MKSGQSYIMALSLEQVSAETSQGLYLPSFGLQSDLLNTTFPVVQFLLQGFNFLTVEKDWNQAAWYGFGFILNFSI